jgi:hypothetical protein
LKDIKKASDGGSKIGAFILCSCLIDALAGFLKGKNTNKSNYKDFVRDYLSSYNPENLYKDLRCKLVHSYSEGGSYFFTDQNNSRHLQNYDGKQVINLENFIQDIESALDNIENKIKKSHEVVLRQNIIQRYDNNGVIQIHHQTGTSTLTPPLSGG